MLTIVKYFIKTISLTLKFFERANVFRNGGVFINNSTRMACSNTFISGFLLSTRSGGSETGLQNAGSINQEKIRKSLAGAHYAINLSYGNLIKRKSGFSGDISSGSGEGKLSEVETSASEKGLKTNSEFKILTEDIATVNYLRIFNRWGNGLKVKNELSSA